jgi:DNA recombination protein RmuC
VVQATQTSLDNSLSPFKDEINEYKRSLDLTREKNIENTASLKNQIQNMMLLSQTMKDETRDLTHALKGDVKSQGNWGEIILERSIEISGLQKGREYTLQGEGLGLKGDDGNHYMPDAIIHLPNSLHIIIDSKVSLKSLYQEDHKELKRSLTKHIDDLSSKAYQKLKGLSSPDYVIMFLPLESIMPILFTEFPEILDYASKKNITLATPISLLPILKTVGSLWRVDSQDKNGVEIARKAGLLYDKFVSLYEGLKETDEAIGRLQKTHKDSLKRLSEGKGDLISRVDELKQMGAKTTKSID